jgi:hypothetical protein
MAEPDDIMTLQEARRIRHELSTWREQFGDLREAVKEMQRDLYADEKRGKRGLIRQVEEIADFIQDMNTSLRNAKWLAGVLGITSIGGWASFIYMLLRGTGALP